MTRKCVICGRTFSTSHSRKIYCSLVCKDASTRLKRMKWKKDNPDYYNNYYSKNKDKISKRRKLYYSKKKTEAQQV